MFFSFLQYLKHNHKKIQTNIASKGNNADVQSKLHFQDNDSYLLAWQNVYVLSSFIITFISSLTKYDIFAFQNLIKERNNVVVYSPKKWKFAKVNLFYKIYLCKLKI